MRHGRWTLPRRSLVMGSSRRRSRKLRPCWRPLVGLSRPPPMENLARCKLFVAAQGIHPCLDASEVWSRILWALVFSASRELLLRSPISPTLSIRRSPLPWWPESCRRTASLLLDALAKSPVPHPFPYLNSKPMRIRVCLARAKRAAAHFGAVQKSRCTQHSHLPFPSFLKSRMCTTPRLARSLLLPVACDGELAEKRKRIIRKLAAMRAAGRRLPAQRAGACDATRMNKSRPPDRGHTLGRDDAP
jgi:hypothetical protein